MIWHEIAEGLNLGHWIAEVVMEIVSYLVLGRLLLKWHDRREHKAHRTEKGLTTSLGIYTIAVPDDEKAAQ